MLNECRSERVLLAFLSLWASCNAPYPDGKIACSSDDECPSGYSCHEGEATLGERFCFQGSKPQESRSPSTGTASMDAAVGGKEDEDEADNDTPVAGTRADGPRAGNSARPGADATAANGGAHAGMSATGGRAAEAGRSGRAGETATAGQSGDSASSQAGQGGDSAQAGRAGQSGDGARAGRESQAGESGGTGQAGSAGQGPKPDAGPASCEPSVSECEPGTTSTVMLPCGFCNSGTQTAARSCGNDCRWGEAVPSGVCMNMTAACEPKDQKKESRGCECGRTQSRVVTCSDACEWVTGEWSACDLAGVECQPNQAQMQAVPCPSCGTRTERRTCAADSCKWGAWTQVSAACASSCEDCAEVQFCMAPSGQPNPGGTKCRQMLKACTQEQALKDCQEDIPVVCGKVTPPFFMQYL